MGKLQEDYDIHIEEEYITDEPEAPPAPAYGSEGWNDYAMSKFHADEMIEGNPLCHGLRRVATLLLGDIILSRPVKVFPSEDAHGPGRSTVVYEVTFNWMNTGETRTFGDVAEVWHGNTDDIFLAHAAATACTKAEGRVLRKALMVKCLAAEELTRNKNVAEIIKNTVKVGSTTNGEITSTDKISVPQTNFIEGKCRQLDINVLKYISKWQYNNISEVGKKAASDMIKQLNTYQQESNTPEEIKGFDTHWKD